jgi:hypothetical protein
MKTREELHKSFKGVFVMCLYHKIAAMAASVFLLASLVNAAMPASYTGKVFTAAPLNGIPQQIPGIVYAGYFDEGDSGVTWSYRGGNSGDCYIRTGHTGEKISVQYFGSGKDFISGPVGGIVDSANKVAGACHLGWIEAAGTGYRGEWLTYTVHVNTAGIYNMEFHESDVDSPNCIGVTFSGLAPDSVKDMTLSINAPGDHENYHDWKWDMTPNKLNLDTGLYVVELNFIKGGWNFQCMKFTLTNTAAGPLGSNAGLLNNGLDIMPVVTGNNLSVSYSLSQAGQTTVSVYDCAGRVAVPAIVRNLNAGSQKQSIGLGNMGRGVYYVRVEQNGLREIKSFTLTR